MMNFHGHKSSLACQLPDVKLALPCTHQGIHACQHYSVDQLIVMHEQRKLSNKKSSWMCHPICYINSFITFKKAPQPETSDLPSKTWHIYGKQAHISNKYFKKFSSQIVIFQRSQYKTRKHHDT